MSLKSPFYVLVLATAIASSAVAQMEPRFVVPSQQSAFERDKAWEVAFASAGPLDLSALPKSEIVFTSLYSTNRPGVSVSAVVAFDLRNLVPYAYAGAWDVMKLTAPGILHELRERDLLGSLTIETDPKTGLNHQVFYYSARATPFKPLLSLRVELRRIGDFIISKSADINGLPFHSDKPAIYTAVNLRTDKKL